MITRLLLFAAAAACLLSHSPAHAQILAGTAKVEITPEPNTAFNLLSKPLAPNDQLFARILVLKDPNTSIAIISVDACVFASPEVSRQITQRLGIKHVIQAATHTHTGMSPNGMRIGGPENRPDWTRAQIPPDQSINWESLNNDPWYRTTEQRIVAATQQALENLFPAQLTGASGPFENAYMAHNRRLVTDKGVTMLWANPDRRTTSPIDPSLSILKVEDPLHKVRALAVIYACHPVTMMNSGTVSRDYPGAMVDAIEHHIGPDCLAMFLQSASGDLDPFDLQNLRSKNRENIANHAGKTLAHRAIELANLPNNAPQPTQLLIKESLVDLPNRSGNRSTPVNLLALQLPNQITLAAIPGEPFIQHQLDLRAALPNLPNLAILGLSYSGKGCPFLVYIPTEQAVKEGGYGATECSFLAPNAGSQIIEHFKRMLR